MNFYIGDTHFGHRGVIEFDNRPFATVDEMDKYIISAWKSRVGKNDDVYIFGDFAYHNEKPEEWYLSQLPGKKHFIIGNHDGKLLKNQTALGYFETVEKMMHIVDSGHHIHACHFPMAEWNGFYKGHLHFYAHIHTAKSETYEFMKTRAGAYNVGCMVNNFLPVTLKEVIANNLVFQNQVFEELHT